MSSARRAPASEDGSGEQLGASGYASCVKAANSTKDAPSTQADRVTARLDAVYATEDSSLDPVLAEIQHRSITKRLRGVESKP